MHKFISNHMFKYTILSYGMHVKHASQIRKLPLHAEEIKKK